jgi:hypothetical protein
MRRNAGHLINTTLLKEASQIKRLLLKKEKTDLALRRLKELNESKSKSNLSESIIDTVEAAFQPSENLSSVSSANSLGVGQREPKKRTLSESITYLDSRRRHPTAPTTNITTTSDSKSTKSSHTSGNSSPSNMSNKENSNTGNVHNKRKSRSEQSSNESTHFYNSNIHLNLKHPQTRSARSKSFTFAPPLSSIAHNLRPISRHGRTASVQSCKRELRDVTASFSHSNFNTLSASAPSGPSNANQHHKKIRKQSFSNNAILEEKEQNDIENHTSPRILRSTSSSSHNTAVTYSKPRSSSSHSKSDMHAIHVAGHNGEKDGQEDLDKECGIEVVLPSPFTPNTDHQLHRTRSRSRTAPELSPKTVRPLRNERVPFLEDSQIVTRASTKRVLRSSVVIKYPK